MTPSTADKTTEQVADDVILAIHRLRLTHKQLAENVCDCAQSTLTTYLSKPKTWNTLSLAARSYFEKLNKWIEKTDDEKLAAVPGATKKPDVELQFKVVQPTGPSAIVPPVQPTRQVTPTTGYTISMDDYKRFAMEMDVENRLAARKRRSTSSETGSTSAPLPKKHHL